MSPEIALACMFFALAAFHWLPLLVPPLRDRDWFWPDPAVRNLILADPNMVTRHFVLYPITHLLFGLAFALYGATALAVHYRGMDVINPRLLWVLLFQAAAIISSLRSDCVFGKMEKRPR